MQRRTVLTMAIAACLALTAPADAQSDGPAGWSVPRTPWGDPDLQGIWPGTPMMGVPQQRPESFGTRAELTDEEFAEREQRSVAQEEAALEVFVAPRAPAFGPGTGPPGHWGERGAPQRQASLVVDPPDGRIPPPSLS